MFSPMSASPPRNRRWPSTIGNNIGTGIAGFNQQQPFMQQSPQQPMFGGGGQYNNQMQNTNYYPQQQQLQPQPYQLQQLQQQPILFQQPQLQQQLRHQQLPTMHNQARNSSNKEKKKKRKKRKGKVKGLRQKIQKSRNQMKQEDIFNMQNFGGGDQAMPSDEDISGDEVIGVGILTESSEDDESDIEIGTTIISDTSDEDTEESDIEIGSSMQAVQRERLDSTASVNYGITFDEAGGDECIAPDEITSKTTVHSKKKKKGANKSNQKLLMKKFNNKFKKFSKQQYVRCSFRINALISEIRKEKLSIHDKKAIVKFTQDLWNKRDIDLSDAELEHRVVRKLTETGFLEKMLSFTSSSSTVGTNVKKTKSTKQNSKEKSPNNSNVIKSNEISTSNTTPVRKKVMEPSPNVITPSSTKEEDTKEEDTNLEGNAEDDDPFDIVDGGGDQGMPGSDY